MPDIKIKIVVVNSKELRSTLIRYKPIDQCEILAMVTKDENQEEIIAKLKAELLKLITPL